MLFRMIQISENAKKLSGEFRESERNLSGRIVILSLVSIFT